jgi:rhomboid protease GluP
VLWSLFLIGIYAWTVYRVPAFYISGAMDSEAVAAGEWWRLFTAMLLHVDLAHLMANATLGCVLFGLSMGQYGGGYGLLLAYLAGAGGNCAGLILYAEPYRSVGASGMVMGALGLLAVHSFGYWRRLHFPPAAVFRALLAGGMLFALLGLDPASDVVAHLGGFVSGIILGAMFTFLPRGLVEKQSAEVGAWTLFAFLLLFTLTRALLPMGREV